MALSDANLIPDAEQWAFEHRDDDVDSADALIDQLIMDDNFLNMESDFLFFNEPPIEVINNDNYSESNSSDSGNHSPKSLLSEQHPSMWKDIAQHGNFSCGPHFGETAHYCNAFDDNFPPSTNVGTYESSTLCLNGEAVVNYTTALNDCITDYPETPAQDKHSPLVTYAVRNPQHQQQSPQLLYIVQDPLPTKTQYVAVPCVSTSIPISNTVHTTDSTAEVCASTTPMKFYVNKRPIPRQRPVVAPNHMNNGFLSSDTVDDEFLKKKEDRKLRNRAAAQLSRQRKRNEFELLKNRLVETEKLCDDLKKENQYLRRRVKELEDGDSQHSDKSRGQKRLPQFLHVPHIPNKKRLATKTAGGVCVFVLMAFLIFPNGNYLENNMLEEPHLSHNSRKLSVNEAIVAHPGRSLLVVDNYNNVTNSEALINTTDLLPMNISGCPDNVMLYNSSKNIKLNEELFDWIERHEKMNLVQMRPHGENPSLIFNSRLTTSALLSSKYALHQKFPKIMADAQLSNGWLTGGSSSHEKLLVSANDKKAKKNRNLRSQRNFRLWKHLDMIASKSNGPPSDKNGAPMDSDNSSATSLLRLGPSDFSSAPISYNYSSDKLSLFTQDSNYTQQITEFISKIKQKNDTLYVVALKDYFLLPAFDRSNGTKSAPKISIILPALAVNASAPHQITMMRIECRVVSTGVFFLSDTIASVFN